MFQKTYRKEALVDLCNAVSRRIPLINSLDYDNHQALVSTQIMEEGDTYIYRQPFLEVKRKEQYDKKHFYGLVEALEYLGSVGLVHGDINRKNIVNTTSGFKIIDFEPALCQIKRGEPQLMVTIPYVSKLELKTKRITILADKLGFFYFILRIKKKLSNLHVVELSKTLNHKRYTGLAEEEFAKLKYSKILDLAFAICA